MSLDGRPPLENATGRGCSRRGGRISMTKSIMWLLIALFFAVPLEAAVAQTGNQNDQNLQSVDPGAIFFQRTPTGLLIIRPRSTCRDGSQSVRVCENDFQSCNSACSAVTVSDPGADVTGCALGCCTKFSACLSIRGCSNLTSLNCGSGTSPSVRALRGQ
jgi:hypothetical protein